MRDIRRADGAGAPKLVVLSHGFVLRGSGGEVDMCVVKLHGKALAESVERLTHGGLTHPGQLGDVVEAASSAENL